MSRSVYTPRGYGGGMTKRAKRIKMIDVRARVSSEIPRLTKAVDPERFEQRYRVINARLSMWNKSREAAGEEPQTIGSALAEFVSESFERGELVEFDGTPEPSDLLVELR